jgi:hypothetical protein
MIAIWLRICIVTDPISIIASQFFEVIVPMRTQGESVTDEGPEQCAFGSIPNV